MYFTICNPKILWRLILVMSVILSCDDGERDFLSEFEYRGTLEYEFIENANIPGDRISEITKFGEYLISTPILSDTPSFFMTNLKTFKTVGVSIPFLLGSGYRRKSFPYNDSTLLYINSVEKTVFFLQIRDSLLRMVKKDSFIIANEEHFRWGEEYSKLHHINLIDYPRFLIGHVNVENGGHGIYNMDTRRLISFPRQLPDIPDKFLARGLSSRVFPLLFVKQLGSTRYMCFMHGYPMFKIIDVRGDSLHFITQKIYCPRYKFHSYEDDECVRPYWGTHDFFRYSYTSTPDYLGVLYQDNDKKYTNYLIFMDWEGHLLAAYRFPFEVNTFTMDQEVLYGITRIRGENRLFKANMTDVIKKVKLLIEEVKN